MTNGLVAQTILRLLSLGPRTLADVQAAMPNFASPQVAAAVEKLKADGLVITKWKRLQLTREGRMAAPSVTPSLTHLHGTYKPPRVVRRPGSSVAHIPSRVGDQLIYRQEVSQ